MTNNVYLYNDPNDLKVYQTVPRNHVDSHPVTITPEQCEAIKHAAKVWVKIAEKENYSALEDVKRVSDALNSVTLYKSCLMGRMLYAGRSPLPEKPPLVNSAPAYWLIDPELCPNCGGERDGAAREIGRSLEPDSKLAHLYSLGNEKNPLGKTLTVTYCNEDWHKGRVSS